MSKKSRDARPEGKLLISPGVPSLAYARVDAKDFGLSTGSPIIAYTWKHLMGRATQFARILP